MHIVVDVFVVIIANTSISAMFECPLFGPPGIVNGWHIVDIMNTELCNELVYIDIVMFDMSLYFT